MWATQSGLVLAAASPDLTLQLIEQTSVVNVLRTDVEQASLIADQLPEELPAELCSDLRHILDSNLGYDKIEAAVADTATANLTQSQIDSSLRWWASGPGRAISKAESTAYASLFPGSSFRVFNPNSLTPRESGSATTDKVATDGHFASFVTELFASTGAARSCLLAALDLTADCAHPDAASERATAQFAKYVETKVREQYARSEPGDVDAYAAYLSSRGGDFALAQIRAATSKVVEQAWRNALQQATDAVDQYARTLAGPSAQATLRQAVADIDNGRNMGRATVALRLLKRAGPPDPRVLVQLARVTLKTAPDSTSYDADPSVPEIDPASVQAAQQLLDQALALEPHHAEALVLSGHVAYLQRDFELSIKLLDQARALGTDNPWLPINLGDALWATADRPPQHDRARAQRAASEFELALNGKLPAGAQERAIHQLGPIYAELGNLSKADVFYQRYVSLQDGHNKAVALHRYGVFLLFQAHNVDAAIVAARQGVRIDSFPIIRSFLAEVLAIKAGTLYSEGKQTAARSYITEASQIEPDLESLCPDLARLPGMLPGVFGIHAAGFAHDFSGAIGGKTLTYASAYATAQQIEQLLAWGANPNFFDPEEGTPLHRAILGDNVEAVRVLLAHGANPLTPFVDGRVPGQLTVADPSDSKRAEILTLVSRAVAGRGGTGGAAGTPLKAGFEYEVKKSIDGGRWGDSLSAGERIVFVGADCAYSDTTLACFRVKRLRQPNWPVDIALAKTELVDWTNWFTEIGPAKQN